MAEINGNGGPRTGRPKDHQSSTERRQRKLVGALEGGTERLLSQIGRAHV